MSEPTAPVDTVAAALADHGSVDELDLDEEQTALLLASGLAPFGHLRSLTIHVSGNLQDTMLAICAGLPSLVRLTVLGSHLRVGTVPYQVSSLSTLEELTMVSCGLSTLPSTLGELTALRKLVLIGQRFSTFPVEIVAAHGLVELTLRDSGRISALPDELVRLTHLRRLDLSALAAVRAAVGDHRRRVHGRPVRRDAGQPGAGRAESAAGADRAHAGPLPHR